MNPEFVITKCHCNYTTNVSFYVCRCLVVHFSYLKWPFFCLYIIKYFSSVYHFDNLKKQSQT